jgi:twinkle protein
MNTAELKARLSDRVQEVCEHLLPAGKRQGHEWCAGSIAGEPGNSLKVCLNQGKAGVWQDFADSTKNGDLIDLWMNVKGVEFVEAVKQAKAYLGVNDEPTRSFTPQRVQKVYAKPVTDKTEPLQSGGPVFDYLTKERKLRPDVLNRYKVGQVISSKWGPTISFPFYDPEKRGLDLEKYLAVERIDGKKRITATKDSKPRLFGWQAIDRNKRDVYITEGEIDALTLAGWDLNALSMPNGAQNMEWIEHDYEALDLFEKIYVCTDMDEPGRKAAAEIAQRLGRERCFRVSLPDPYKDVNQAHCSGSFLDDDFYGLADKAKTLDPVELRGASEFSDGGWEAIHPTTQANIGTMPPIDIPWRCRFGEVSIWAGYSGHGKTLMLNNFVVHDASQGEKVCLASLEMPASKLVGVLTRIALGKLPETTEKADYDKAVQWLDGKVWIVNKVGVMHYSKLIPILEYAARRYGCTRFVIDSLVRLGIAEDDYNAQKEAVGSIVEFAAKFGHVHLVCHSRKQENEDISPGKLDVRGSGTITDLIHNGFTVWRNKKKEQELEAFVNGKDGTHSKITVERERDALLTMWKNREEGVEPWRNAWLNKGSGQFLDFHYSKTRKYV